MEGRHAQKPFAAVVFDGAAAVAANQPVSRGVCRALVVVVAMSAGEGVPEKVPARGELLAEISREIVQLHRRFYGKGPTKAKTYAVNDTIVCLLSGGFTTVEQTLIADGKADEVEQIRRSFQRTMRAQFTGVVERATGRRVIAYMSQVHSSPDLAVELFVLNPADTGLLGEHEEELPPGEPG